MFDRSRFENSRSGGGSVLEIVGDVKPQGEQSPRFVPLKRTEVHGELFGPFGSLRVEHTFGYSRQQCDRILEAVYRFPLPGDAAVVGVRVRFGEVEIRAILKERQRAERDYEAAKRLGRQAALLTRESPDVFTLQVAGIEPGVDIVVETDYVQVAHSDGAGWTLRLPLTTAPRYVRCDELASRHSQGQPLCLLRDPGHRFSLHLVVTGGEVQSPTHRISTALEGDCLRVRLADGEVLPDRDCVLNWRPRRTSDRPALQILLHDDPKRGDVYFLAVVAPPVAQPKAAVPRETILLIDHSGSMEGPKWAATDWAAKRFLSTLGESDVFNLGLFHNDTRWFDKGMKRATPNAINEAVQFLEGHKDSGGTELGVALEQALSKPRFGGNAARHVLIITDAEVSDAGRILRLADEESAKPQRRRIDVLCIDAAPNSFLASELANRCGGVSKFLTSNPEQGDIATALDEVLTDWDQPVHANLKLVVNRSDVLAAGRAFACGAASSEIDLGDLPGGRSIWVAGRIPRLDGDLAFQVVCDEREIAAWKGKVGVETTQSALKALFGAGRVLGLEFMIESGYSGVELREQLARLGYDVERDLEVGKKVYAENQRQDLEAALKRLLVREALEYGLASSETAFVAERTQAGRQVEATVLVGNALPSGWSEGFLSGTVPAGAGMGGVSMVASDVPDSFLDMLISPVRAMAAPSASIPSHVSKRYKKGTALKQSADGSAFVFDGVPSFQGTEAVLFDWPGNEDSDLIPESGTLTALRLEFGAGVTNVDVLDIGLVVSVYIDDLAVPRARVRLADLMRQGGERPLNLNRATGQSMRIVLSDPNGVWKNSLPAIRLALRWN